MPRTERQNTALREATRARVLRAALHCFSRHGFAGTTMRLLAERAGMSVGLIYRHFPSRTAILVALFEDNMAQVRGTFAEAMGGTTAAQRVERLALAAVDAVKGNLDFWRLSYALRHQPAVTRTLGSRLTSWTREIEGALAGILSDAGVASAGVEAALLFAAVDGICQQVALAPRTYPAREVVRALASRTTELVKQSKEAARATR